MDAFYSVVRIWIYKRLLKLIKQKNMKNNSKGIAVIGMPNLSKELKERLIGKMIDKNDDKIIERMQQRQSHIESIKRLDNEIVELTTLTGLE